MQCSPGSLVQHGYSSFPYIARPYSHVIRSTEKVVAQSVENEGTVASQCWIELHTQQITKWSNMYHQLEKFSVNVISHIITTTLISTNLQTAGSSPIKWWCSKQQKTDTKILTGASTWTGVAKLGLNESKTEVRKATDIYVNR